MKKIIGSILVFILLTAVCTAYAQTDKEITFRGFEWGQTLENLRADIEEKITTKEGKQAFWREKYLISSPAQFFIDNACNTIDYIKEYNYKTTECLYTESRIDFAAHPANAAYLMFARTSGVDEDSIFYRAMYYLEGWQDDSKDLQEKLTALYGEPDIATDSKDQYYHYITFTWNGANNTFCSLRTADWGGSKAKICLTYGTFDGDEWLETADQVLAEQERQKEEADKNNSNGL